MGYLIHFYPRYRCIYIAVIFGSILAIIDHYILRGRATCAIDLEDIIMQTVNEGFTKILYLNEVFVIAPHYVYI